MVPSVALLLVVGPVVAAICMRLVVPLFLSPGLESDLNRCRPGNAILTQYVLFAIRYTVETGVL
jgi:hypothetical protein